MPTEVRVRGRGRVELAAHGLADAERQVERELGRLWPEARLEVLEVARRGDGSRLVEEFVVTYRLTAAVDVPADDEADAPRAAFRHARGVLSRSRYRMTEWEKC